MTEDIFSLILQLATYDGDTFYSSYEELVLDFRNAGAMALVPAEVKKIAHVAYMLGRKDGAEETKGLENVQ